MIALEDWQPHAACRGKPLAWWFPRDTGNTSDWDAARLHCRNCPVANHCLDYAVTNALTDGMYGGLTPRQRAAIQPPDASCGTPAGYARHRRNNTFPCEACVAAHSAACRRNRLNQTPAADTAAELVEAMR